jgi:hypothetical protein
MKRMTTIIVIASAAVIAAGFAREIIAQPKNFNAQLSGANEVPAVSTQARGNAVLQLNADGTELSYRLIVANITDVRASHIHLAPEGANGPVVVTLFPGPTIAGPVNGVLAEGTITASDLAGPLAGMPLSALIENLNNGDLYINVHTDQVPSGEIRGQIK